MDRPVGVLPGVMHAPNVSVGRIHQTQKPMELMRQVVQLCVPKGRVLDPFCGGGTTLLAARLEGREAVGILAFKRLWGNGVIPNAPNIRINRLPLAVSHG